MVDAVNGMAAADTLLGYTDIAPGYCLAYVWTAYAAVGAHADGSYATAYDGWLGSSGKHEGDWNPPPGVPVYFGPRDGSSAGDVVISRGDQLASATDWDRNGVTGVVSLQDRQNQIARPYLGWTDNILGCPIDYRQGLRAALKVEEEPKMTFPMCFDPNVLCWPNGFSNAYEDQVYNAIKSYVNNPTSPSTQWVRDTFARENWAASDYMQASQTAAFAALLAQDFVLPERPSGKGGVLNAPPEIPDPADAQQGWRRNDQDADAGPG